MKLHFHSFILLTLLLSNCIAQPTKIINNADPTYAESDLIINLNDANILPKDVLSTYTNFVNSITDTPNLRSSIESFCLPQAITISANTIRPENMKEYGQDLNLHFLTHDFSPQIFIVRKESKDKYLIRTGTTAIWFVKTSTDQWKIYKYLDKPIE